LTQYKTILYSALTLVLLSACSNPPEQKTETVIDHKLNAVTEAKETVDSINSKTAQTAVQISRTAEPVSGSRLYVHKCASCHGKDAKKSALNASVSIAGWDTKKTQDALNGYKNGTFGGKMKAIMEGQSKPLSDEEIKLISEYISIL